MEELPNNFDVVIIGTGMPECIIAAAASRVGKTVLHLDRNVYYGGEWASFNFEQFLEWIEDNKIEEASIAEENISSPVIELSSEERLIPCIRSSKNISNIIQKSYVRETPSPTFTEPQEPNQESEIANSNVVSSEEPMELGAGSGDSNNEQLARSLSNSIDVNDDTSPDFAVESHTPNDHTERNDDEIETPLETVNQSPDIGNESNEAPSTSNEALSALNQSQDSSNQASSLSHDTVQQEWTVSGFRENRRKFNFDLAPKLLFARGSLVELLISSNIARYAEFQCVNRVLTFINGHIEQVPCSRADVFSTKNVTVVEKRMLMKLLTFCMNYQDHPDEYSGFEEKPFLEFLRSRKLTANIEHYVMHAIAMVEETCPTLQGLEATQKFMQSLGRYGNSPFLWTCYGSAELPQCFCRLCAVFGGIYYLQRVAEALIISDRCQGIVSRGQRINCQWVVMESSYAPVQFLPEQKPQFLSRSIFITDASLLPAERPQNTLLRLSPMPGLTNAVTVLEFGSKAYICPEDLYIVYMFCRSSSGSPEDDLKPAVDLLFKSVSKEDKSAGDENMSTKPNILWSIYYNQKDTTTIDLNSTVPEGILLTSSPDVDLDYEQAVKEAKEIFEKICPGENFLPRAPDPEDIILENHANPGEGAKIENDVKDSDEHDTSGGEPKDASLDPASVTESLDSSEATNENDVVNNAEDQ